MEIKIWVFFGVARVVGIEMWGWRIVGQSYGILIGRRILCIIEVVRVSVIKLPRLF